MLNRLRRLHNAALLPTTATLDNTVVLLVGIVLFALYANTAQPVVGFEDSAGFASSCRYGDIAHAPGYPLYVLLCQPFSLLTVESPAQAAAWFSALCAAAAALVLTRIVYLLTTDAITAIGAAALFGVSRSFWSQATIPEVYTLNVLLFFLALLWLLQWRQQPSVLRLAAIFCLCGLALANHWPLYLLAVPTFLPLLWRQKRWLLRRLAQPKCLLLWLAAFAIGLLPYLYLYWRTNHPVAFMHLPTAPADLQSLWRIISRDIISPAIDNPTGSGWNDKAAFAAFLAKQTLAREVGLLGGAFMLVGFFCQRRQLGWAATLALCLLFAGATLLLLLLLNFLHDESSEQVFSPYPLLPYAAACIWAALAVRWLFGKWRGAALAVLCLYALWLNYPYNDRSNDTLAADIADMYLDSLPPGAFFPLPPLYKLLAYRQYTTGKRSDVRLLPPPSPYVGYTITPGEKLYPPNTLSFEEEMAKVDAYAATHPVCYNTFIPFSQPIPSREYLLFSCLRGENEATFSMEARITEFLRHLAEQYPQQKSWQARRLTAHLIGDAVRTLMQIRARRPLPQEWGTLLEELSTTPAGQLALMEYLATQPALTISAERAALFERAATINLPLLNRRQRARMLSALGDSFAAVNPRSEQSLAAARRYHRQAATLLPAADAPGVQAAYRFYQREELTDALAELLARYGQALLTADTRKREE